MNNLVACSILRRLALLAAIVGGLTIPAAAGAADYYVSTSGNDANPGSSASPWRHINYAAGRVAAGDTVHVAAGTYNETVLNPRSAPGTASAHIRFISDTPWGAKVAPSSGGNTIWEIDSDYTDVIGFDLDGSANPSVIVMGFYVYAGHDTVKGNHVHHIDTGGTCNSNGGAAIATDNYGNNGYNDDVIGNWVDHIGYAACPFVQGIYAIASGNIMNNVVYQVAAVGIHLWHDPSYINIANNTVFASGLGILVGAGDCSGYPNACNVNHVNVFNNIVFDCADGVSEQYSNGGSIGTNNTYYNNLVYQNSGSNWSLSSGAAHFNDVTADPQFVNYISTGGGDYHLKSTSPAIDKGTSGVAGVNAPSADFDGSSRPKGAGFDIGAYEYNSSPTPTPTPAPSPTPTPTPSPTPTPTPSPTPSPTGTITITSPANGARVGSSVTVNASVDSTTCNSGLNHMQVLVNGRLAYSAGVCQLSASVAVPKGTSTITVQAIRWDGALMAQSQVSVYRRR